MVDELEACGTCGRTLNISPNGLKLCRTEDGAGQSARIILDGQVVDDPFFEHGNKGFFERLHDAAHAKMVREIYPEQFKNGN